MTGISALANLQLRPDRSHPISISDVNAPLTPTASARLRRAVLISGNSAPPTGRTCPISIGGVSANPARRAPQSEHAPATSISIQA
jgi:hypothetical protein